MKEEYKDKTKEQLINDLVELHQRIAELEKVEAERKRVEEKIKQTAEEWRTTFDSITDLVFISDKDFRLIRVNKAFADAFKVETEELIGKPCYEIVHGTNEPIPNCPNKKTIETKKPATTEFFEPHLGVHLEVSTSPIFNEKGVIVGAVHIAKDITERKQVEEEIRKLSSAVEQSIDGIAIGDLEPKLTYVNDAFARMHGYSSEEMIGMKVVNLHNEEQMDEYKSGMNQIKTQGGWAGEIGHIRKDGAPFPTYMSVTLLKDADGKPTGILAAARDITERNQAEEERNKLLKAIETTKEAINITTPDTVMIYTNDAMDELFGYKKGELIGKHVSILNAGPAQEAKEVPIQIEDTIKKKGVWEGEIHNKRKDGTEFICLAKITALTDKNGKIINCVSTQHDITERKRVEEELKQKTGQQEVLLSSIPAFVYYKDIESNLIAANKAFAEMVNVPIDQLAGKDAYDLFPKEQAKKFHIDDKKVMSSGRPIMDIEEKFTDAEGKTRWASTSKVPSFDEKGKVTGMVGITFDITERKRAEEALRSSEERLKILFEFAPDAYYLTDLKGTFVDGNKAAEEITGYKRSELIGKRFLKLKLLSPKQILKAAKLLAQNVLGKPTGPDEFTFIRKDGSPIALEISTFPMKIKGQTLVLGIARDITERKQMEEALRESEGKFRLLSEQNLLGIIILQDGFVKYANQAACEITEYSSEEALNWGENGFAMLLHPDDLEFVMEQAKKKQQGAKDVVTHYSYRMVTKSGKVIWVDQYSKTISFEGRNADLITLTDITERKQAEEERKRLLKELEAKNAEMKRFTYTVSHDLRSPLVTVQGFAEMLRKDLEQNELEKVKSDLKYIESSATKMDRLLTDTLKLSRIGRMVNPPEDVPFGEIVQEAQVQTTVQIKSSGVEVSVAEDFPAVHVDRMRIVEVLVNLITNSINYMGEQSYPKIDIGYRTDDGETVFFVRDNGVGIDESQHEKVFELFYTVDKSGKGTGAGLAIVKRIIEVHNGRIWIESEKGKGCTVCFTLPVA